ncbi:ice-binding family protein [Sphaerisporangium sp. NPDC005289]|uniref:ice-binding family protein n=1 Tax=Sphaerisporangium sp. NPDC005289 TaxID=3155247 RepID=UPI0033BD74CD
MSKTFFSAFFRRSAGRLLPAAALVTACLAVLPAAAHAAAGPESPPGARAAAGQPRVPRIVVPPVALGDAADCAVLAGKAVTNTGMTLIVGDVNVSPGTTVTGFPPGMVRGSVDQDNAEARRERAAAIAAYNDAAGRPPTATVPQVIGDDAVMTPGVYDTPSDAFILSGTLKLDAQGDPNAVFIFQASTLVTLRVSNIDLLNGARTDNVIWQVGDSAFLGTLSTFRGNVLARNSVTVNSGAAMFGRAIALNSVVQAAGTTSGPATRITVPTNPPTVTTLTSSPNPSHVNQPVTFTATVMGTDQGFVPTGTVLFRNGSVIIGSAPLNTSAVATFTTSALPMGARQMTAVYVPNGTAVNEGWVYFEPSQSAVLVQQVIR